jgi:ABC-type multidrug transport system permease subunit
MSEFMTTYFGPLSREYCAYFYFMSILFFLFFILSIIGVLSAIFMKGKKVDFMFIVNSFMLILNTLLAYFVNRLLNTMCNGSVK